MAKVHATLDLKVPASWRVRFAYRGDDIRPVSAELLRMIAPGSTGPPGEDQGVRSGAFIEVLAGGDKDARWSRTIDHPNRADREVFLEDGGITRITAPAEGEFDVVIPDFGPNALFVLYASPSLAPEDVARPRVRLRLAELGELGRGEPPDREADS